MKLYEAIKELQFKKFVFNRIIIYSNAKMFA